MGTVDWGKEGQDTCLAHIDKLNPVHGVLQVSVHDFGPETRCVCTQVSLDPSRRFGNITQIMRPDINQINVASVM